MIFYILILILPLLYFIFNRKTEEKIVEKKKKLDEKKVKEESEKEVKQVPSSTNKSLPILNKTKENIVNSFKETKDVISVDFSSNGQIILFHDEKRFYLVLNSNLLEKKLNILSKSIEYDTISSCSYANEAKIVVVGLKNSKEILFYQLKEQENKLFKFEKLEKTIKTKRKDDIKKVGITNDGLYAITSGAGQDTEIQIYDIQKSNLIESININQFENEDLKLTPDSKFITISTSMNEIVCISFNKQTHHVKNSQNEEVSLKVEKKNSVSIKEPILNYSFTNDNSFFVVLTKDSKVKIYQNYSSFYESKSLYEHKTEHKANSASAFLSKENLKVEGYYVYSSNKSLYLHEVITGKLINTFEDICDSYISSLKIIMINSNLYCISLSKDGRFNIIDLKIK